MVIGPFEALDSAPCESIRDAEALNSSVVSTKNGDGSGRRALSMWLL